VAAAIGPRTRAILATHLYGHPCAVDELATIAAAHGLIVIEDFAHALGAKLHGKPMGSIGRVGFCSFSGKHITVFGPGGAAVTDDPALAEAMSSLRDQGRNRDHRISFIRRSDESWYDQERIGLNLHLSEVSAALGRHQLRQLPQWHAHRRAAASTYGSLFSDWGLPLELPPERAGVEHAYLHYTIKTPARDQLKAYLHERGIETQVHYPKALHHLEPVRRTWPDEGRNYPIADRVAARVLSLPVGPHLNRADIERIADGVRSYFQSA
jgi:dTDP-4-amino-4,6-dideoxygalactose transaminase